MRPRAALTVILGVDEERDRSEIARLGLPMLDAEHFQGALAAGYAAAGFVVTVVRSLSTEDLAAWPSSWAGAGVSLSWAREPWPQRVRQAFRRRPPIVVQA
jgi:hypothetical protein